MGFQQTFKALSDDNRRKILHLLRNGPMTAGEIGEQFQVSGATISHHLDDRHGKYIYYELNMSVVDELLEWVSALKGENHDKTDCE